MDLIILRVRRYFLMMRISGRSAIPYRARGINQTGLSMKHTRLQPD
jgi:hypothetical protein